MPEDPNQPSEDQTPQETDPEEKPEEKTEEKKEEPVVTEAQPPKVEESSHDKEQPEAEKPKINIEEEVKKQINEKVLELLQKANEKRKQNRENNLNQIIDLAKKKQINNQDARDLLQVSQSTSSEYLTRLTKSGKLKSEGKGKAKIYKA